jgi:phage baseplate assembly protein W
MAETIDSFLGFGIVRPFVRDAADFASAGGFTLVRSCVGQVLGTRAKSERSMGEVPWRNLGSKLHLLRHRKGPIVDEMARFYAREALGIWEPRVEVVQITTELNRSTRARNILTRIRVIDQNVPGNNVLLPDETLEVEV